MAAVRALHQHGPAEGAVEARRGAHASRQILARLLILLRDSTHAGTSPFLRRATWIMMPIRTTAAIPPKGRQRDLDERAVQLRQTGIRGTRATWELLMPEVYVSTDVETDGPIPGPHSMLSFASAAYLPDKSLVGTFTANLEPLPGAQADPGTMN